MKQISFGSTFILEAQNRTIAGIDFFTYLQHTTANTAFAANLIDMKLVNCKLVLRRGGFETTIFNDTLRNLVAYSVIKRQLWAQFVASTGQVAVGRVQLAAASGVKEIMNVPFYIELPGVINLRGDDKATFTANFGLNCAAATVDTAAPSAMYADWMDGVGVEWGVPAIKADIIEVQSTYSISMGGFVRKIVALNFDKKSYLTANRTITLLNLQSDKFNRNDSDLELQTKNAMGDFIPSVSFEDFQSYLVYNGKELHNVQLELSLNSANITLGENVIVWGSVYITDESAARANAMVGRHKQRDEQFLNS